MFFNKQFYTKKKLRIFKLAKSWTTLNNLIGTVSQAVGELVNVTLILGLRFIIFVTIISCDFMAFFMILFLLLKSHRHFHIGCNRAANVCSKLH